MHVYEEIKDMLCEELEEISKRKGDLTAGMLDNIDKITHSIKSIETIMAMHRYDDDYSHDSYSGGKRRMSYTGRHEDNRHEAKHDMIRELKNLMDTAHDDMTKTEFSRFITKLESM